MISGRFAWATITVRLGFFEATTLLFGFGLAATKITTSSKEGACNVHQTQAEACGYRIARESNLAIHKGVKPPHSIGRRAGSARPTGRQNSNLRFLNAEARDAKVRHAVGHATSNMRWILSVFVVLAALALPVRGTDFSEFKTADELWSQIQKTVHGVSSASRVEYVGMLEDLRTGALEFEKRYPDRLASLGCEAHAVASGTGPSPDCQPQPGPCRSGRVVERDCRRARCFCGHEGGRQFRCRERATGYDGSARLVHECRRSCGDGRRHHRATEELS